MLLPVVSSAVCSAIRPLSAVWSPCSVGIVIALGVQVEDVQGAVWARPRNGLGGAVGVVAVDPVEREHPHQVVEEAEFDLHQRAVASVLALELMEQSSQLGAADVRA